MVIAFAYRKEIPLFADVGLYLRLRRELERCRAARRIRSPMPTLLEQALTHRSYGAATTNGWNSSATACSAAPWPTSCTRASRSSPKAS